MQALTVMLSEMAQGTSSLSEETLEISTCVEKLVRYLEKMKTVDAVAENAYSVVCSMLRKHEKFARRLVPGQWLHETMQSLDHDLNAFANMPSQENTQMDHQYFPQSAASPALFDAGCCATGNEGLVDLQNPTDPLNQPFSSYQFGQTQYPIFYGDQPMTSFDQEVGYDFDDTSSMEDWNTTFGQQQQ
jgi:hypothetical protein